MKMEVQCIFADETWTDMPSRDELVAHMRDAHLGNLGYLNDEQLFKYINMRPMFNAFRRNYDSLTYEEIQQCYNTVHSIQPGQRRFNADMWTALFNSYFEVEMDVIELGGYDGELFRYIVRHSDANINSWVNCEFSNVKPTDISDSRYCHFQPTKFLWDDLEYDYTISYHDSNVFVASHVIEHISARQFLKLVEKIISNMDIVLLEIPLPKNIYEIPDWHDYHGFHVFEGSWHLIQTILEIYGFNVELFPETGHLVGVKQ